MMTKKSLLFRLTLGMLLGSLIMPAQTAHALPLASPFVYDHTNHQTQIKKWIDETKRWINMMDNGIRQYTTLRGVLGKAEELITDRLVSKETMKDIGLTVRSSIQLKEQLQAIMRTRLTMLTSIDDRLRRGIFNPEADLRDLEDYLRSSIGRSSEDSLANLERLRRMDNTLERLIKDLQEAELALADANLEKTKWDLKLAIATDPLKPPEQRSDLGISTINQNINNCKLLIERYDNEVKNLRTKIEVHTLKYHKLMEARVKFGLKVKRTNQGWRRFNEKLAEFQQGLKDL